jgi:Arc/MetJ-type ribon-helix-helix transcriptional regulator
MTKQAVAINMSEERREEINEAVESGEWRNRSTYLRHMIQAGESRVAALDPRTDNTSTQSNGGSDKFATDEELISELSRLTKNAEGEFVSVDEIADKFVKEIKSDITDRVFRMANDDESEVQTDKTGGYRVDIDE